MKKDAYQYLVRPEAPPPQLVIPDKEKTGTLAAIDAIRKLFGPKGEYWIKGEERITEGDVDKFCLVGAAKHVNGRYEGAARAAIAVAIEEQRKKPNIEAALEEDLDTITKFNDTSGKDGWQKIKAVLARAKQVVKQA